MSDAKRTKTGWLIEEEDILIDEYLKRAAKKKKPEIDEV